ncbi:phage holin [Staphylococcus cohnii]|uniref:phage holin n=1 Tax=Staphylococcus cohnii TaxID=29382 RepID=UPI00254FE324|nr:phage holin [Staphylococcus cohnii]WIL68750.1 phage holin [Staphylococcus cohnii]WIL68911.1 phage holin [Staphylococcus cohnii]
MNFILRLKNKATLTAIVGAILVFIKQVAEAFGVDLSAQIEQVSGLVGAIIMFLVGIGVVTDPTTVGVKDSGITKTYAKPRDENENPVEYQREGYEPEQWNDDFAEEVEIEEGLRDVEDDEVIVDNFDSDINNSGVMLDTNQQVEGVVENGENTSTDK